MKKIISTDKAPAAIGPYSQAVEVNGLVFTSGVIPIIPETGELVEGGIEKQAEQAIGNLKALIEASGAKIEDTIKTVVFIKDMNDFAKVNEIYSRFFTGDCPSAYFNIGKDRMREIVNENRNELVLVIGRKNLIKRKKMEEYLDRTMVL